MKSTLAASQINDSESLYPNPNNGIFTLSLTNGFSDENITVIDLAGRIVFEHKLNYTQKQKSINVNLNTLSNGLYIVKVHNGISGANFTERLIINNQ